MEGTGLSSEIGRRVKLSLFGESHGEMIGCTLHDLPPGEEIDLDAVRVQMARRAPGGDPTATARRESDAFRVVSGLWRGKTTGSPLTAVIENEDAHSGDYENREFIPRPGHADHTGYVRYRGAADIRGGGHFSGRLTAPLVFAGAVCRQILRRRGVAVGAHILSVGRVSDVPFDNACIDEKCLDELSLMPFAVIDRGAEPALRAEIERARQAADSVGGVVQCAATGLEAGLGSPMFNGVENELARMLFGIPAVKGVSFGDGFDLARMRGSQANDSPHYGEDGILRYRTNRNGGILGGITNGAPLVVQAVFKPTPSIGQMQSSVDLIRRENTVTVVKGRHDPCIVPRAVPVVEAAVAVTLLDIWLCERA